MRRNTVWRFDFGPKPSTAAHSLDSAVARHDTPPAMAIQEQTVTGQVSEKPTPRPAAAPKLPYEPPRILIKDTVTRTTLASGELCVLDPCPP